MKAESYFYINAFKASGSKEFESYLTHAVQGMFQSLIDQLAKGVEMDPRDGSSSLHFMPRIGRDYCPMDPCPKY